MLQKTPLNRKKILIYSLLAYGISWLIWLPNGLTYHFDMPWEHSNWLHIAGGLGPCLSALIVTRIFEGPGGLKRWIRGKLLSLPQRRWLLLGAALPVIFFLIAFLVLRIFTGQWEHLTNIGLNSKMPLKNPWLIWLAWCLFYGLGEEGGWRGLLYPELIQKYSARKATLITAAFWGPWHLPVFFYDKDFSAMGAFGILGWATGLVFGSFLLGWLVKQADFNLWPVILWHGTFNFFTTSDHIHPLFPALISALVIISVLWLARQYNEDFHPLKLTQAKPGEKERSSRR